MATRRKPAKTAKPRPASALSRAVKERDEALRFQAATAEILASLSRSRESPQPVFDAIVQNVLRLFDTRYAVVFLIKGEQLELAAVHGNASFHGRASEAGQRFIKSFPQPIDWTTFTGLAMKAGEVRQLAPIVGNPDATPRAVQLAKTFGYNSMVIAPLVLDGRVIGAINTNHGTARRYSDKELAVLKAFADQAVIAIENARLFKETKEALERQKASAEILRVIARSPGDIQPVLDAMAETAARLCGANDVIIRRLEGDQLRLAAHFGSLPITVASRACTRETVAGRAVLERRTTHVEDILSPEGRAEFPDAPPVDYHTILAVPLVRDGAGIGVILLRRLETRLFSEQQVKLLESFADQAVIAMENARLFNETKEALEQQTATGEILSAISATPTDAQPVFEVIARSALRIFGGMDVGVGVVDGDEIEIRASTLRHADKGVARRIPLSRDTALGRAILERTVMNIGDIESPDTPPLTRERGRATGWRSVAEAPMLREGAAIGFISVHRAQPGPLSEKQMALLKTFADQAVIAIENVRLFNETKEALERQTATAQVLTVIAGSPSDVQPVFDAIVESGMRLLKGATAHMTRLDTGVLHLAAYSKTDAAGAAALQRLYPLAVAGTVAEQVLEARAPLVVADAEADPRLSDDVRAAMRARGVRSFVLAPLVSRGRSIGTIVVNRRTAERFSDHETRLLQTFADQAVIAIENVRLFNETNEALEQQTAISEVLRVISSSPSDVRPVLQAVAERAARICDAKDARLFVVEGDKLRFMEQVGDVPGAFADGEIRPIDRGYVAGRCVFDKAVLHIEDIEAMADEFPTGHALSRAYGIRTFLAVPLMREQRVLGAILLRRSEVRPFSDKQIELLKTFADQAAIAIENVRLFNETKEALERQTATGEILASISNAINDAQPVFDAIVGCLHRLFDTRYALVALIENGQCVVKAMSGEDKALAQFVAAAYPYPADDERMLASRAIETGREVQLCPIRGNPEAPEFSAKIAEKLGYDGILIAPLVRAGTVIGYVLTTRIESTPFDEKQIALIKSFADQAVIAIENARLFGELQASNNNLSTALDQQTATSGILSVISRSTQDVQPVFDAIAQSAVRLLHGWSAVIWRMEGEELRPVAFSGGIPGSGDAVRAMLSTRAVREMSFVGKALREREPRQVLDSEAPGVPEILRATARIRGWRSNVAVPMLQAGSPIGMITLSRAEAGGFTQKEIELLKTFADQAVIAIENVRLFNETKEALERQTATAEILKVISSSTTDTQPVFEAIVRSAARLFPMSNATIFMRDGDLMRMHAVEGATVDDAVRRELASIYPIPFNPEVSTSARAMVERQINICLDTEAPDVPEHIRRAGRAGRFRSNTVVPLVRDDEGIGTIVIAHPQPGYRLNEKQLALLRTFADQAVIAIANTRLFNELEARNKDLAESLEQQTATSEVLKVISRTKFDLEPVLNIVMDNALKLCAADRVIILRANAEGCYVPAAGRTRDDAPKGFLDVLRANPIRPDSSSATGRAVKERTVIHIPDVLKDPGYGLRDIARAGSYRTLLAVPMLREGLPIGVLALSRAGEPKPFTDKQVALVTTFADQAVIAIENVRLFNEIQEKTRELEVANRHKSEFLANMSHELRTPLNAIIGFSEVLIEKMFGEVNDKQLEYLNDIHESGRHLLSLINDILDLSKIEAGRMELELSRFSLPGAIGNAMTLVRERAQRHGIELGQEIDPRLGEFQGDERKVKQMLLNLLSNAVKFTPDGGRVDVSAKLDTGKVEIAVRDTGIGIAPADQAALFEEFRQVGRDGARKAEGTGLGLALTKKFAELHGGTIRVDSAPGAGATFTVSLPLR